MGEKMRNYVKLLILIVVMVLTISCTVKYIPIPTNDIIITEDFGIYKTKGYSFAAENKYWVKDPQDITDYFTTFYVTLRNKTSVPMNVDKEDLVLLDELGNQYDAVSIDYLEKMLLPKQLEFLMLSNIEDSNTLDNTDSEFSDLLDNRKQILERWRRSKRNLITYSFHFGKVQPGAQKSGYVFFPKLESRNNKCQIVFRGKKIEYIRSDVKDKTKFLEKE